MRASVIVVALVALACGPRVSSTPRAIENDLDEPRSAAPVVTAAEPADAQRVVAPPGKGLRTGTIARARLVAVLDAGPGTFLRQLEVAPRLSGDRFVGWQLVQLIDRSGPLHDVDLVPGDVLLAINGKPLSRPEQLQVVWDSLRTANEVAAQMWRGDMKLELRFTIEPPVR
jgi:type II secretory pathway component PulC